MNLKNGKLVVLATAAAILAGCNTQPIQTSPAKSQPLKVEASYGIEGDSEAGEETPMPEPVDVSKQQPKKITLKDKAIDAFAKAVAKNKEAKKAHFEWNNTKDVLKEAEAALKAGKYIASIELSNKAFYFAERGLDQAKAAKNVHQNYMTK